MQEELNEEMVKLSREIFETQKEFSIRQMAHTQILSLLLNLIDDNALQRIKKTLEIQSSSGELQASTSEAYQVALQIVSLATEDDAPPDPIKTLRLIQGGKNES